VDGIRVMSGGVYMVDELGQLDDGNDTVIQSREQAVVYFSGSTYSGASHNAEVIRELLGVESEDESEQDTKQSDEESESNEESNESDEEQEDESDGEGKQSDEDESEDESEQQEEGENGDDE